MKRFLALLLFTVTLMSLLSTAVTAMDENDTIPSFISIAQPKTRIIGGLAIVREINNQAELDAVLAMTDKPATAILYIDARLNVLGDDGEVLTTVSDFLSDTGYSILPAFYVKDRQTAEALTDFIFEIMLYDVFLMSDDPALVKEMRQKLPATMGIIDFTKAYAGPEPMTEEQCLEVRRTLTSHNATVAYLPFSSCGKEQIQYLYGRRINVWVKTEEDPDITAQTKAILSGAYGVVSDETVSLLDIACKRLQVNTMTRIPSLVGHRGSNLAPENTVEGALLAYEMGADAIEVDVYLSSDGEIVLMHDGNTARTCNADLPVEASTLEQLKTLYVNRGYESHETYSQCRIPTLNELLEAFKGTDCLLVIEIKTANPAIAEKLATVIEEYDMYGNCNIISFDSKILQAVHAAYPTMPIGLLCPNVMTKADDDEGFRNAMEVIGYLSASYNPSGENLDRHSSVAALYRGYGIYSWTYNGGKSDYGRTVYMAPLRAGFAGITGDDVYHAEYYVKSAALAKGTPDSYRVGDTLSVALEKKHFCHTDGEAVADEDIRYLVLSGDDCVHLEEGKVTFSNSGTVTLVAYYTQKAGSNPYYLCSDPFTVTVTAKSNPTALLLCVGIGFLFVLGTALLLVLIH
ncbi:MAG: hypothetical protein IJD10_05955, partial [Clostridia bacterium]|nr:hypothetical protein [Clostridia bacterium]